MRWAVLAVGMVAAALPDVARAAECAMPGHGGVPQVRLVATEVAPVRRHDRSKGELSALNPALRQGQSEAGLTSSRAGYDIRPQVWVRPLDGHTTCIAVKSVEVDWRIALLTIDIASDYPEGSCAYQAIKDHENQHVAITRAAFARAAVELRRRLDDAMRAFDRPVVLPVPSAEAAQAVAVRLQRVVVAVADRYQEDSRRANATIDTPASYARVHARCRDW